jgi:ABC-type Fe3+/spermidine/putrescine transport system ATPase subunit
MLRLDNLSRFFGSFSLKNISLEINSGEYFVLLGPCGAGKTLLLQSIAGIHLPDTGRVFVDAQEVTYFSPEKRNIGYLFQKNLLFPHLSIKENIDYGLKYHPADRDYIKSVFALMDIDNLIARKDTCNLSGGETQKIALARSLVIKPRLLLLDEPLHSLDPANRENVLTILKFLNKNLGLTLIHVTHNLEEAKFLAGRAAVLIDGVIVQEGTPEDILRHPRNIQVQQYLAA